MGEETGRIILIVVAIVVGLWLYRRRPGRGDLVCGRCGFPAKPGTPACPRCGRALDTTRIELARIETARRRGEINETDYRRRKLEILTADDAGRRDRVE